jgi:DNA-binding NarL/FixJ family response regulator
MSKKVIEILLISDSKLLIDGLCKILESEDDIKVSADLSGIKEVITFMDNNEPNYIFLDQRVKDSDMEKFLLSKKIKSKSTEIIMLAEEETYEKSPQNVITVNQNTGARELIDIIKKKSSVLKDSKSEEAQDKKGADSLTKTESRIINLIASGHTNKEIAEKLRVSEKTIKAHITSIFIKLNIQNRYQLMVYGRKNKIKA